jgi:biopolymer transport protein ExbB/TolQ
MNELVNILITVIIALGSAFGFTMWCVWIWNSIQEIRKARRNRRAEQKGEKE